MVARTLLAWIRHSVETVRAKEFQGSQTHISPSFSRHILASPHCYGTEERARAGAVSLAFQARALTTGFAWGGDRGAV